MNQFEIIKINYDMIEMNRCGRDDQERIFIKNHKKKIY